MTSRELCPPPAENLQAPERGPLNWNAVRRSLLAVVAAGSLGGVALAKPNRAQAAGGPEVTSCPLDYMTASGDVPACEAPVRLPAKCAPETNPAVAEQIHGLIFRSKLDDQANLILDNHADTAPTATHLESHLEFGAGDEYGIRNDYGKRRESLLDLVKDMGGSWVREVLYVRFFNNPNYRRLYDQSIKVAKECGLKVYMTLALDRVDWTPRKLAAYFNRVAKHFKGKVFNWGIENEPNLTDPANPQDEWLRPMNNTTRPQTARLAYQIGRRVFTAVAPRDKNDPTKPYNKTDFGELSSLQFPLKFARQVFTCAGMAVKHCKKLVMDGFAVHTWMLLYKKQIGAKGEHLPNFDQLADPNSRIIDATKLPAIVRFVHRMFKRGRIATPEGTEPPIDITETGVKSGNLGNPQHNQSDQAVAKLTTEAEASACQYPQVRKLFQYMIDTPPPFVRKNGDIFSSAIIKHNVLGRAVLSYINGAHTKFADCLAGSAAVTALPTPATSSPTGGIIEPAGTK